MLDDDKPDYFLSDNESTDSQAPTDNNANVIDFSDAGSASDTSGSAPANPEPKHHRGRKLLIWTALIALIVLATAFYLRYCSPYAEDAAMEVYVVNVEKSGPIFKTYEAQVVSVDRLSDTTQIYSHPEQFTVGTEALAHTLQSLQGKRIPVTLRYEKFYATLPWRGASKWVITGVEQ